MSLIALVYPTKHPIYQNFGGNWRDVMSNPLWWLCRETLKLLPALRLSRQKTNLSSSHFASIWSCSMCLVGIIFGGNAVLHLDN